MPAARASRARRGATCSITGCCAHRRRALEGRLTGLGPTYAIGMIDVDNFKQFNDAHGHHIGDQVLKLVAARLATIEGGGTSYRYGGEEFCVLFSDRTLEQALPHLERLR